MIINDSLFERNELTSGLGVLFLFLLNRKHFGPEKLFFNYTKFISRNVIFNNLQIEKLENFTRSRSMFAYCAQVTKDRWDWKKPFPGPKYLRKFWEMYARAQLDKTPITLMGIAGVLLTWRRFFSWESKETSSNVSFPLKSLCDCWSYNSTLD